MRDLGAFCKRHNIKMHSTFVAALVLAMKRVRRPEFERFDVLNIVSYREDLKASNTLFRPLFSWIKVENVNPQDSFLKIAELVHTSLHRQRDEEGRHILNLKITEMQLAYGPTSAELLSRVQFPPNLINVTNRGRLESSGSYPEGGLEPVLTMPEIYGVGGNTPYFGLQGPGGIGITVGVTTYKDHFYTTASMLEDERIGLGEQVSEQVLQAMESILIENAHF